MYIEWLNFIQISGRYIHNSTTNNIVKGVKNVGGSSLLCDTKSCRHKIKFITLWAVSKIKGKKGEPGLCDAHELCEFHLVASYFYHNHLPI